MSEGRDSSTPPPPPVKALLEKDMEQLAAELKQKMRKAAPPDLDMHLKLFFMQYARDVKVLSD